MTTTNQAAGHAALVELGGQLLRARDARGEWRPMRAAQAALCQAGASPIVAALCVQAMGRVVRPLRAAPPAGMGPAA